MLNDKRDPEGSWFNRICWVHILVELTRHVQVWSEDLKSDGRKFANQDMTKFHLCGYHYMQ